MSAKWEFSLTDFPPDELKAKAYVRLNLKNLLEGRGHTELLGLWKIWLYLENSSHTRTRKVRTDDPQKKAFALSWAVWHLFWQNRDAGHPLSREACFNRAAEMIEDVEGHELSTIYRRWKKDERVFCMPEVWAEAVSNYRLLDAMAPLRAISPVHHDTQPKNENEFSEFTKEIRLIKRLLKRLRQSPKVTQRELCRALTVRLPELTRALERLEFEHVISWNRPAKTISWAWWNPKDGREFVWLSRSSYPGFGPKLETGKAHRFSDYNSRAVEEWIRTGAAEHKS